jgi:hypothetical protein
MSTVDKESNLKGIYREARFKALFIAVEAIKLKTLLKQHSLHF